MSAWFDPPRIIILLYIILSEQGVTNLVYQYNAKLDEALLPLLDDALQDAAPKNFYVLHLMGTHAGYKERYPTEYNLFSATDETKGTNDKQKATRAQYDNAVRYNDFIVNEIIRRFENKNAIIIYVSDHGEECYEDRDFFGHIEANGTFNMIEIPMLVWESPEFISNYPLLHEKLTNAAARPFMTDDMLHVLLDIMQIETPDFNPQRSIINPAYDSSRQRLFHETVYNEYCTNLNPAYILNLSCNRRIMSA